MSPSAFIGVRVTPEMKALVRRLAEKDGMTNVSPRPKEELLALKQSIAELRAIGSNLNQMARILNQGGSATSGAHEVLSMLKVAEGLRKHFRALLVANEKSWESGHAEERR